MVIDSKTRNQYKTSAFVDLGVTNDTRYYYQAFPYSISDAINVNTANHISATPVLTILKLTPDPGYSTAASRRAGSSFGTKGFIGFGLGASSTSVKATNFINENLSMTQNISSGPNWEKTDSAAASVNAAYLLVAGGGGSTAASSTGVFAWNASFTAVTDPAVLNPGRYNLAGASVSNYAIFAGGYAASKSSNVDVYATDLARTTPPSVLSSARDRLAGASFSDKNYAIFGPGGDSHAVDAYNTSLSRFSCGTYPEAMQGYYAGATLGTTHVIFAGGANQNGTNLASVNVYNKSLVRSPAGDLSAARRSLAGTALGEVALFGGGKPATNVVDIYDKNLVRKSAPTLTSSVYELSAFSVGNYAVFIGGDTGSTYVSTMNAYYIN